MHALQQIVSKLRKHCGDQLIPTKLRKHCGDQLILQKSAFSSAPPTQTQIPEKSRNLIAFAKLNAACQELENRQKRSLSLEEREARFISIRGLLPANRLFYNQYVNAIQFADARYAGRDLKSFTFAPTSRDARIKEGDFLLGLSNEDCQLDLDVPWRRHLGLRREEAQYQLNEQGIIEAWAIDAPLAKLLQVEVIRLAAAQEPPFLVLASANPDLFQFAQTLGLLNLSRSMVIDPFFQDFDSKVIQQVLKALGGTPPPLRKKRK